MILRQIRVIRIQNNLTQQQVADVLGVSRSTYCSYESGRRSPDIDTIATLSRFYRLPIEKLISDVSPSYVYDASYYSDQADTRFLSELSPEERELIVRFRMLKDEEKKQITELAKKKSSK